MIILEEKIGLRQPVESDIDDLLLVKNNKDSASLLGGYKENDYTREEIAKWIDFHNTNPDELLYVIYDFKLEKVIGHVGLYNIDNNSRKAEFGILIGNQSCKGKGYGSLTLEYFVKYGFESLNLNRIELSVLEENAVALRLYEKFGFVVEGVQKQALFKNDRYYNVVLMAILNENYVK